MAQSASQVQTEAPHVAYWRTRSQAVLERLEREARRMFQLESELSQFSQNYYAKVGEAVERLTVVEQQLAVTDSSAELCDTLPAVLAQRDAGDARHHELKSRYRSLAKEVHPDRMTIHGNGTRIKQMHAVNAAYQQGDLAALLRLEAEMVLAQISDTNAAGTSDIEHALHEVEKAANTYAEGYRALLNSPLNDLMLRAMAARLAGWDWMDAVVKKIERSIVEKERAAIEANIAQIGAWRAEMQQQAVA